MQSAPLETFLPVGEVATSVAENSGVEIMRTLQMADTMLELRGSHGAATVEDLRRAGYTFAEIEAYGTSAAEMAAVQGVNRIGGNTQNLANFIDWAKLAIYQRMPTIGQQTYPAKSKSQRWQLYCAARAAYQTDPWVSQRERCLSQLTNYITTQGIAPRERNRVLVAVNGELAKIAAANTNHKGY